MELGGMLAALLDTRYEPAQPLQPAGCVVVDAVDSMALIVEGDQGVACTARVSSPLWSRHSTVMEVP